MKVCGIVAEYNPFHNGHLYHIEETKRRGATHVVAVMSGNFVQRAEPAIISKFERARLAALGGVDLVVELPVQYAAGSSERFARGAVALLDALGCVESMSFGSECGDMALLQKGADAALDPDVIELTRGFYETGMSYPAARERVAKKLYGKAVGEVLRRPNNILGVEYLKALRELGSPIEPVTFRREGADHDGEEVNGLFASAKFLREEVRSGADVINYVPFETKLALERALAQGKLSGGLDALSQAVLFRLRTMTDAELRALPDCGDGLGDRLYKATRSYSDLNEILAAAKTKRYTMSRVRRAVISALLGVEGGDYFPPPYIRLLAVGRGGKELLGTIGKTRRLPMSESLRTLMREGERLQRAARKTKEPTEESRTMLRDGENMVRCAKLEAHATDIYNLSLVKPAARGRDFTAPLFKVNG